MILGQHTGAQNTWQARKYRGMTTSLPHTFPCPGALTLASQPLTLACGLLRTGQDDGQHHPATLFPRWQSLDLGALAPRGNSVHPTLFEVVPVLSSELGPATWHKACW